MQSTSVQQRLGALGRGATALDSAVWNGIRVKNLGCQSPTGSSGSSGCGVTGGHDDSDEFSQPSTRCCAVDIN